MQESDQSGYEPLNLENGSPVNSDSYDATASVMLFLLFTVYQLFLPHFAIRPYLLHVLKPRQ